MELFNEFVSAVESMGITHEAKDLTIGQKHQIADVYGNVKSFLADNNLVSGSEIEAMENFNTPIRTFSSSMDIMNIGPENIIGLCQACNVPEKYITSAIESIALCIENYRNNYNPSTHFRSGGMSEGNDSITMKDVSDTLGDAAQGLVMSPVAAVEAFGSFTDNTIADARVAITVALLRYHRGTLHRFIPSVPINSNVVTFKVNNLEVYDLIKSQDANSTMRYDDAHRIPFVELYNDPTPADTTPKRIVLRVANDTTPPKLLSENVVKINTEVNMFDYTLDTSTVGFQAIDYTDLVGEGAKLDELLINVAHFDGTTTTEELIPVSVVSAGGARFVMAANANSSADRVCNVAMTVGLTNTTVMSTGGPSTILGALTNDAVVNVDLTAMGSLNLKTSNTLVHGSVKGTSLSTVSGNTPVTGDSTIFGELTITVVGYKMLAQFSEENVRKTTKAMRIMTKLLGYEIPGASSVVVQYEQNSTRPEVVIDGLSKLLAIGNDSRGIDVIMSNLTQVYDRLQLEANSGGNYTNKVMNDFAAGQKVKPTVIMETINITNAVANRRSAEMWEDIRGVAEKALMEIVTRINNLSFYVQALEAGEKPVFKVLTSGFILSSILSVPHYHNAYKDNGADVTDDGVVEFRRTLPNGVVLDVITSTFDFLADKMIIIPCRPAAPKSELNFGQNIERGTYVAHATPVTNNAIYNQLVANAREFPIVTNPIGSIVQVSGISNIFDGIHTLGA